MIMVQCLHPIYDPIDAKDRVFFSKVTQLTATSNFTMENKVIDSLPLFLVFSLFFSHLHFRKA